MFISFFFAGSVKTEDVLCVFNIYRFVPFLLDNYIFEFIIVLHKEDNIFIVHAFTIGVMLWLWVIIFMLYNLRTVGFYNLMH